MSDSLDKQLENIIEKLAEIEHERWSDWQSWCHKILRENCPSEKLENVLVRWDKQINTKYNNLSEKRKEEDRKQVYRYLDEIKSIINSEIKRVIEKCVPKRVDCLKTNCMLCSLQNICGDIDVNMEVQDSFNECRKQTLDNVEKEVGR